MRTRLVCVLLAALVGCGGRQVQSVDDDAGPGSGSDAAPAEKSNCPYPNGTCDFDSDCPEGQRCDGATHTTGVPHTFVCRGVCVPEDDDEVKPCPPISEAVQVELELIPGEQAEFIIRQTNVGCAPVYELHDCCGGFSAPALQVSDSDGGWMHSPCNAVPEPCACTAEPTCDPVLAPGETREVRWPAAGCSCPGGTVRAAPGFFTDASCTAGGSYFSNELLLGCAGGTP